MAAALPSLPPVIAAQSSSGPIDVGSMNPEELKEQLGRFQAERDVEKRLREEAQERAAFLQAQLDNLARAGGVEAALQERDARIRQLERVAADAELAAESARKQLQSERDAAPDASILQELGGAREQIGGVSAEVIVLQGQVAASQQETAVARGDADAARSALTAERAANSGEERERRDTLLERAVRMVEKQGSLLQGQLETIRQQRVLIEAQKAARRLTTQRAVEAAAFATAAAAGTAAAAS